jgi:hypothetical protein
VKKTLGSLKSTVLDLQCRSVCIVDQQNKGIGLQLGVYPKRYGQNDEHYRIQFCSLFPVQCRENLWVALLCFHAKRRGKRVTLVRDRLYINNELYIVPEENYINEMEEDAFEIGQENLEDDFIPYWYTNRTRVARMFTRSVKKITVTIYRKTNS